MKKTTIGFPDDDPNESPPPRKVSADELFEPQWTPIENLPDPAGFAINFTHRAIEVLHGIRDAAQLARWVSEDVYGIMRRTAIAEATEVEPAGRARSSPHGSRVQADACQSHQPAPRCHRSQHHGGVPLHSACCRATPGRNRWPLAGDRFWLDHVI